MLEKSGHSTASPLLLLAACIVCTVTVACSSNPQTVPQNHPTNGKTYKTVLESGGIDIVAGVTEVRLKGSQVGDFISVRGRGFENTYPADKVKSVIDRDGNVEVRNPVRVTDGAAFCPPLLNGKYRSPRTIANCGDSGPPPMFTACFGGPCGDDGMGGLFNVGLVLNFPGNYCYYDFPNDLPDCYATNGNGAPSPPPGAHDLYLNWIRVENVSVEIICSPAGAPGRLFAFYHDAEKNGFHTSDNPSGLGTRGVKYPSEQIKGTIPPLPVATIEVNFLSKRNSARQVLSGLV
jgi:hypothetical protein